MPKTKQAPTDPERQLIGQVADLQRDLLNAVETALMAEARGEDVADDLAVLLTATGWDRKRIQSERSRCERIVKFRAEARAAADRDAARDAADRIARETADRRREIETQIAALSAELRGLEGAERAAVAKVERQERAVARLRDDAPEHVKRRAALLRSKARDDFGRTINAYTSDIRHADHLASLEGEALVDALRNNPATKHRCLHSSTDRSARIEYALNGGGFAEYLASLEIDRKRDELPGLREQFDAALAEADSLLDFYVGE